MRARGARYGAIVAVVVAAGWFALGLRLEGTVNRVDAVPLPPISPRAQALHASSFVSDLHADSLLFGRNLLERSEIGHVDLPRLQQGGVGLQVFSLPTIVPLGQNVERTERSRFDLLTLAGIAQLSPTAWLGPTGRSLHRAGQLRDAVRESDGALVLIETRADLERLLSSRAEGGDATGALLALEGAHALESEPENLQILFDAGYRMIGLTHFFDNDYGGSAHGVSRGGLTELGRETLREMERFGITLDLAHLSPQGMGEALDLATRPVVFSHGGVRGTCDNQRNLSDEHVRRIAEGGGVVGIGYWDTAVCGRTPADIARAIVYVVRLVGADHVGFGSDYDGGTTTGFDTSQLVALTQALIDEGLGDREIRKVLGDNVLRVLSRNLPPAGTASD
ncbi:MAG: peptidase M19 [Deltaproteobacteria bacterium]|nr:peptidase M19 [Deltaproteobacteria bacterium]